MGVCIYLQFEAKRNRATAAAPATSAAYLLPRSAPLPLPAHFQRHRQLLHALQGQVPRTGEPGVDGWRAAGGRLGRCWRQRLVGRQRGQRAVLLHHAAPAAPAGARRVLGWWRPRLDEGLDARVDDDFLFDGAGVAVVIVVAQVRAARADDQRAHDEPGGGFLHQVVQLRRCFGGMPFADVVGDPRVLAAAQLGEVGAAGLDVVQGVAEVFNLLQQRAELVVELVERHEVVQVQVEEAAQRVVVVLEVEGDAAELLVKRFHHLLGGQRGRRQRWSNAEYVHLDVVVD